MSAALLALLLTASPVHRYALVVGSNVGEGVSASPLHYADDDAVAMHELLLEAGVESVLLATLDADTSRLHPGSKPFAPATLDALRGAFAGQRASMLRAQAAGEEVEWLFFFSGHGDVERGQGFLGLESGRVTRAVLHDDFLARVPAARIHVVLDACRSGALVGSKGPGGLRLPMPASFAADPSWPLNAGFVLSASSARESHEWEQVQGGVFSYEVRSALRGAADADGDGSVTYAELGAFLETANRSIENPRYRPDFLTLPPRGREGLASTVISWPAPGLETALDEHVYVERGNGERLLDLHGGPGHVASIHLPSERPLFVRSSDEQRELSLEVSTVRVTALSSKREGLLVKGARDRALTLLFDAPFDLPLVQAWTRDWKPAELSTFVVQGPPQAALTGRTVAAVATIGGLVVAATGFAVAWERQAGFVEGNQRERAARNEVISAMNALGIGGLALSVASAITWGLISWRWELSAL